MVRVINVVNEPRVESALVAIHQEHGDGTIWSARKKIKFIKISQYLDKNLTVDTATLGGKGKAINLFSVVPVFAPPG